VGLTRRGDAWYTYTRCSLELVRVVSGKRPQRSKWSPCGFFTPASTRKIPGFAPSSLKGGDVEWLREK
jgi:hypothetical protein